MNRVAWLGANRMGREMMQSRRKAKGWLAIVASLKLKFMYLFFKQIISVLKRRIKGYL